MDKPSQTQEWIVCEYLQQLGIEKGFSSASGQQAGAPVKQNQAEAVMGPRRRLR